ncbi:MAG: trehalose-6-phosphate synthase [Actinomycetota bacterium]|nr:trehalose-6-phosphate synthase [Actinomycetota bacterium]
MTEISEKIIVVSNRIPCSVSLDRSGNIKYKKGIGGLVTAMDPILSKNGGLWIGWDGQAESRPSKVKKFCIKDECGKVAYSVECIHLTKKEIKNYYHGLSNRSIWPLFHGFIFQSHFNAGYWKTYVSVNRKFCDKVLKKSTDKNIIWVHDYQLTMLPRMLKQANPKLKILYFLHIPFPNYEIFRVLPLSNKILDGMLGASLLGFQTKEDRVNFLVCCKELLGARVNFKKSNVFYNGRTVKVKNFPISIDYEKFNKLAKKKSAGKFLKSIKRIDNNTKIIMSVERLDYTKGIKERILSIERFFEKYPSYRRKVIFIQVSVPTRTKIKEYITLKKEIDELVGRINGKFADELWSPIHYIYKAIPQQKLASFYKAAEICLVTPLRDGMNLVAKEYVSCKTEGNGVLILSKFAGAAEEMSKYAVMVNPYDIDEVADSINIALNIHWSTRKKMISNLRNIVRENDIFHWASSFLNYYKKISG